MAATRGEDGGDTRALNAGTKRIASAREAPSWRIEEIPHALLDRPIDYLAAEHARQRRAAELLLLAADGVSCRAGIENLSFYLRTDFAMHIVDEEQSLFPLLRERCKPEDCVDALIDVLRDEHAEDEALWRSVEQALDAAIANGRIDPHGSEVIRRFADKVCEHISLEDGVLIPLARLRLTRADLKALSAAMRLRRAPRQV